MTESEDVQALRTQLAEREASLSSLKEKTKAFVQSMRAELEQEKAQRQEFQAQLSEAAAAVNKAELRTKDAEAERDVAQAAQKAGWQKAVDEATAALRAEAKTYETAAEQMAKELEAARVQLDAHETATKEAANSRTAELEAALDARAQEVAALRSQLEVARGSASAAAAKAEAGQRNRAVEVDSARRKLEQTQAALADHKLKTRAFVESLDKQKRDAEQRCTDLAEEARQAKQHGAALAAELEAAHAQLRAEREARKQIEEGSASERAALERQLQDGQQVLGAERDRLAADQRAFRDDVQAQGREIAMHREKRAAAKQEAQKLAAALELESSCRLEGQRLVQQLVQPGISNASGSVASLLARVESVLALYVDERARNATRGQSAPSTPVRHAANPMGIGAAGVDGDDDCDGGGVGPQSALAALEGVDTLEAIFAIRMPQSLKKGRTAHMLEMVTLLDTLMLKLATLEAKVEQMVEAMRHEDEAQLTATCCGAKFIALFTSRAPLRRRPFKRNARTGGRTGHARPSHRGYGQLATATPIGAL